MKNHTEDLPTTEGRTFHLGTGSYNLTHTYGHWVLVRVTDGKPHEKSDFVNKNDMEVFKYLASAEKCTQEEARSAYENTKTAV